MIVWKFISLALNNYFSYRNVFQIFVKNGFKNPDFVKELKISCSLDYTILLKFH